MRHPLALSAVLGLAACVQTAAVPVGQVSIGADSFPVTQDATGNWRVRIDGQSVTCAKPTEEACYWSARHHLTAQDLMDDMG